MTFRDFTGGFAKVRYRVKRGGVLFFIALTLVGTAALVSANNLLFLIVAAMLATLLISGLVSRLVLAGLELELVLPEHISARRPTAARLRLRNTKRLIPSFSIHLTATGTKPVITQPAYFPVLPGGHTADEPATALFPLRGAHRENLFSLSTRFPFGFLEKRARVTLRKDTLVYPSLDPQPAVEAMLQGLLGEITQNRRGHGTDLYRIRPYVASESARHVDWRSSAHTGALQIREYSAEELGAIVIALDRSGNPPHQWFEMAIECCAYLVWELSGQNRPVVLISQDYAEFGDRYAMLKFLALTAPIGVVRPLPEPDDAAFQILFSTAPNRGTASNSVLIGIADLQPDSAAPEYA